MAPVNPSNPGTAPIAAVVPKIPATAVDIANNDAPIPMDTDDVNEETEEASLISALALLHQMHTKLTLLRQSIPHMIQPIMKAQTYPTPEALFSEFSTRTLRASEDLVEFTTLVSDGRWVFEKAAKSRKDEGNTEAVRRWKSSLPLPAYLKDVAEVDASGKEKEEDKKRREEEEKKKKEEAEKEREVEIEEVKGVESDEVRKGIVEEFKKQNGDLEVGYDDDDDGKLKVTLPKTLNLTFTVEMPAADAKSNRYIVTLPTSSYLHILILRSITTRPNAGSLKYLLDMISNYTTIYKTKCTKCNKLTNGPKADLPVIRRLRKTIKLVKVEKKEGDKMEADGEPVTKKESNDEGEEEKEVIEEQWVVYHEGCAP